MKSLILCCPIAATVRLPTTPLPHTHVPDLTDTLDTFFLQLGLSGVVGREGRKFVM